MKEKKRRKTASSHKMRESQNFARAQKGRKRGKILPDKSICKGFQPQYGD